MVEPVNRALARFIDRRDQHMVSLVETAGEILEQVAQTCIAMRLANRDQLALPLHGAGSL